MPNSDTPEIIGAALRGGYGVEDIAMYMKLDATYVRETVDDFRDLGLLSKWWPRKGLISDGDPP